MKRARNVLVLIWKQFLPHKSLKGTQRSSDYFLKTTVLRWCTYDATLKQKKKIWVLLFVFIFKIRQKLSCVNTWCLNWCWYTRPRELSVLSHHVLREGWVSHLSGELAYSRRNCSVRTRVYFTCWLLGVIVFYSLDHMLRIPYFF